MVPGLTSVTRAEEGIRRTHLASKRLGGAKHVRAANR